MRIITTTLLVVALSCMLTAENLEKTQKKELEAQAKAAIAEAKSLEKSGHLVETRAKYAERRCCSKPTMHQSSGRRNHQQVSVQERTPPFADGQSRTGQPALQASYLPYLL